MRKTTSIAMLLALASPAVAWAGEGYMPVGTVVLSAFGMCGIGAAGLVCLKIYASLKGGDLGMAWQTLAFALLFFGVALLVEVVGGAGWIGVPPYVPALLKLLAAVGLVFSFLRFSRVFQ